jgi:hypothetical protein
MNLHDLKIEWDSTRKAHLRDFRNDRAMMVEWTVSQPCQSMMWQVISTIWGRLTTTLLAMLRVYLFTIKNRGKPVRGDRSMKISYLMEPHSQSLATCQGPTDLQCPTKNLHMSSKRRRLNVRGSINWIQSTNFLRKLPKFKIGSKMHLIYLRGNFS